MKEGRNLQKLAEELERQVSTRKDFLAESSLLKMEVREKAVSIAGLNGVEYGITKYAHGQFASTLGIPQKYYDKMKSEVPELLANNVNVWLEKEGKRKMIRTLDGDVRAFLSSSYRPLDNYDLAEVALPILRNKRTQVVSSELTETRMYLKAIMPELEVEIKGSKQKGDIVQAGIVISNSEVGAGSLKIEPLIYRLVCLNGMIAPDSTMKKYHVGKVFEFDGFQELLTDEARQADDRAFWLKVRDVVTGAFDRDIFLGLVSRIEDATQNLIKSRNLPAVVEVTTKRFNLSESHSQGILAHLTAGGDLSQWGLINSVTRASQDVENYEQATELERVGGKILELDKSQWSLISEAA